MATRTTDDNPIPSGFAGPTREPHEMRMGHPEEGEARGETWTLLRAVALLIGAILLIGYLIS